MSIVTAGRTAAARSPRRHLLITLVSISVALNIFFVAGAAWTRLHAPPASVGLEERYDEMAAELKLDPQQRAAFDRYVATIRPRVEEMRRQVDPLIASAWDEVAKPQTDTAQVMGLFDQATEKRREFQRELAGQTLAFLSLLSPEQRSKFVAVVREHRAPWFHPRPTGR